MPSRWSTAFLIRSVSFFQSDDLTLLFFIKVPPRYKSQRNVLFRSLLTTQRDIKPNLSPPAVHCKIFFPVDSMRRAAGYRVRSSFVSIPLSIGDSKLTRGDIYPSPQKGQWRTGTKNFVSLKITARHPFSHINKSSEFSFRPLLKRLSRRIRPTYKYFL